MKESERMFLVGGFCFGVIFTIGISLIFFGPICRSSEKIDSRNSIEGPGHSIGQPPGWNLPITGGAAKAAKCYKDRNCRK